MWTRNSQNITAETIRPAITAKTKAIIAVHLAGWPCDMDPILELAEEYGLKVIEDCAQAHGATYKGKPVGSLGHMAAFSFCQDKILTTGGEGGMVTTNDEQLWNRAWSYKDHGKSYDAVFRREHPPGFRWLHESFGTNWRLTEMQSALGRVMLRKLPRVGRDPPQHAAQLTECFRSMPALRVTEPPSEVGHSYYKYYVFVRPERLRAGMEPGPDHVRDRGCGRALFFGKLQRNLSGTCLCRRNAAIGMFACGARIRGNQSHVPGSPNSSRCPHRDDLRRP